MKTALLTFLATIFVGSLIAQPVDQVVMADGLRASGMIYVVVAVMAVIFLGLLLFLFSMDRRLQKLEKSQSSKN
jgi:CcmD family protein